MCRSTVFNPPTGVAPFAALASPDSGHTCVSCPHPCRRYPRSSPWPKSGFPNRVSSANVETAETASSTSALLTAQESSRSIPWAESSRSDGHDRAEHSTPRLHTRHNHISHECLIQRPLSLFLAKSETGTLGPKRCDTGSAISSVITYEIGCSLFPPFFSKLRHNSKERITVSGFQPYPSGTGVASPHHHTHRVWVSTSN